MIDDKSQGSVATILKYAELFIQQPLYYKFIAEFTSERILKLVNI